VTIRVRCDPDSPEHLPQTKLQRVCQPFAPVMP